MHPPSTPAGGSTGQGGAGGGRLAPDKTARLRKLNCQCLVKLQQSCSTMLQPVVQLLMHDSSQVTLAVSCTSAAACVAQTSNPSSSPSLASADLSACVLVVSGGQEVMDVACIQWDTGP
jgi:hypothetical protein